MLIMWHVLQATCRMKNKYTNWKLLSSTTGRDVWKGNMWVCTWATRPNIQHWVFCGRSPWQPLIGRKTCRTNNFLIPNISHENIIRMSSGRCENNGRGLYYSACSATWSSVNSIPSLDYVSLKWVQSKSEIDRLYFYFRISSDYPPEKYEHLQMVFARKLKLFVRVSK